MATSGLHSVGESDQQAYRCSVCLDNFQNPKLISCGHTFCLHCLRQLPTQYRRSRKSLQCPECRCDVELPSSGKVGDFPTNFAIKGAIEQSTDGALHNLCVKHKKKQELFCDTCRACICVDCFVEKHKSQGHEVTSGTVQGEIVMEQLFSAMKCYEQPRFTALLDRITEMEEKNDENDRDLVNRIAEVRDKMVEDIQKQAEHFIKFVKAVTKDKKDEFKKRKQSIQKKNDENSEKGKQCSLLVEEISKLGLSQERFEKGRELCDIREKDYTESGRYGRMENSDDDEIDYYRRRRHYDVYHTNDDYTPTEDDPLCDDSDDKHKSATDKDEEFVSSSVSQLEQLNNVLEFEENHEDLNFVFGMVKQSKYKLVDEKFYQETPTFSLFKKHGDLSVRIG